MEIDVRWAPPEEQSEEAEPLSQKEVELPVYLVFGGRKYYPRVPVKDYRGRAESLPEAEDRAVEVFVELYEEHGSNVWVQLVQVTTWGNIREVTTLKV